MALRTDLRTFRLGLEAINSYDLAALLPSLARSAYDMEKLGLAHTASAIFKVISDVHERQVGTALDPELFHPSRLELFNRTGESMIYRLANSFKTNEELAKMAGDESGYKFAIVDVRMPNGGTNSVAFCIRTQEIVSSRRSINRHDGCCKTLRCPVCWRQPLEFGSRLAGCYYSTSELGDVTRGWIPLS